MAKRATPTPRPDATGGTIASNRRAGFEYEVLLAMEAGLVLEGPEIKSLRGRHANIAEAYARIVGGELWLYNMHVAPYTAARENPPPTRPRKLLLHRKQIARIEQELREQPRTTLVPLRLYLSRGMAKVEIALVRGRRQYDKRQAIAAREAARSIARATRHEQRAASGPA